MSDETPRSKPTEASPQVVALEEKLMFQQRALEDLNEVVLSQQAELGRLRQEIKSLRALLEGLMERGVGDDIPHEKPPHY